MQNVVKSVLAVAVLSVLAGCASSVSRETPPELSQKIRIEVSPPPTAKNPEPSTVKAECTVGDQHFALEFIGGALIEMPPRKMRLIAECPNKELGIARAAIDPDSNGRYPQLVQMRFGQNLYFKGPSAKPDQPAKGVLVSTNPGAMAR